MQWSGYAISQAPWRGKPQYKELDMGASLAAQGLARRKILIVDDEPELVRALSVRLNSAGYSTLSAADGAEATDVAIRQVPDLILLDIGLPRADGYEVAGKLRSTGHTAHIPIVFLTARTWDLDKANQVSPEGYVVKPYEPTELLTLLDRLTGTTRSGLVETPPRPRPVTEQ
jgi:CheY-like chemotaxis protein